MDTETINTLDAYVEDINYLDISKSNIIGVLGVRFSEI